MGKKKVIDVLELLESGVESRKKRKKKEEVIPDIPTETPTFTLEDFEQMGLLEEPLPDPNFDYRNFYTKGDEIHLVRVNSKGEKVLKSLKIRTVFQRNMVTLEKTGECCCIGYEEKDQIFNLLIDAKQYYDSLNGKGEES